MAPIVLYHTSDPRNRLSIFRRGLLARKTTEHNYPGEPYTQLAKQPIGVFAYQAEETDLDEQPLWSHVQDVWKIVHVGPMAPDRIIKQAFVVPEDVPRENIELVRGTTLDSLNPWNWNPNTEE